MCPLLGFTCVPYWVLLGWNKDFAALGFVGAIICASVLNTDVEAGNDGRQLDIVR